jgi:polyisoprenoid-binding protein YceI
MEHTNTFKTDIAPRFETPKARQQSVGRSTRRKWWIAIMIVAVLMLALLAIGAAYIWFSGGSGQPSSTTSAPALVLQPDDTRALFQIRADESEARFIIDETLLGNPKTVVGSTNEVAGDLLVDFANPTNSRLGMIRINVRTLETDNEFRTRALRGQILQADRAEFEFAEFAPTALVGLPDNVTVGEPFDFQIKGNLTVHGVTREITFNATLIPVSEARLEGNAWTTVMYQDFGMTIPEASGVANVADEVRLEIDFVATTAEE